MEPSRRLAVDPRSKGGFVGTHCKAIGDDPLTASPP